MTRWRPSPRVLAALVVAHVIVVTLTWRDIRYRTDDQIRGSKRLWRIASAGQMGNALVYWLFARKRID